MNSYIFNSKIGKIRLEEKNGALCGLHFAPPATPEDREAPTGLLLEARRQLEDYLAGRRKDFSLPLAPDGTPFMRGVWAELGRIPYGSTVSYKDIAVRLGKPGAARAVGQANNKNPIAIIIPCHRVIGSAGGLTGYAGGLEVKRALLRLEGLAL